MFKNGTALIVDDQEDNREILCEILKDTGRVIKAANGMEALSRQEEMSDEIEGIIRDLVMPVMDGCEFLERRKISEHSGDCGNGRGRYGGRKSLSGNGAWDMVRKPYNPRTLLLRQNIIYRKGNSVY